MAEAGFHFEMWVGEYLGATATASIDVAHLDFVLPFVQVVDGETSYDLVGDSVVALLDAIYSGALNEERRWVLGLPLLARDWVARRHGAQAAEGALHLRALPLRSPEWSDEDDAALALLWTEVIDLYEGNDRLVAYESIFEALRVLGEKGALSQPGLHEGILGADPSGNEGAALWN